MSKILFIGAVASIIAINSVFADTTVTTQNYVDSQDEAIYNKLDKKKQNRIPATGTNANTPGSTVVTYTDTAGTIGERGILEPTTDYANEPGANELVTVGRVSELADSVANRIITTKKKCYQYIENAPTTDANCLLWRLEDQTVYGRCRDNNDCDCSDNSDTPYGYCDTGKCRCQANEPSR